MKLEQLTGIGEKTAGALNRLGIFCAEDLLYYYPRAYETFEVPGPVCMLKPQTVGTVEGVLAKEPSVNRFGGMLILNAFVTDMTGRLQLSWYNTPYLKNSLRIGEPLVFRGRVYEKNGRLIMSQPKIYRRADYQEKYEGRLLPVYPLTKGVTGNLLIRAVTEALRALSGEETEYLEDAFREHQELEEEGEALIRIHFPRSGAELERARRRIVFDEFFLFLLAGRMLREKTRQAESSFRIRPDFRMLSLIAGLPYELTKGQQDAYKAAIRDMSSGKVMNRLIEGDVGSGKTIVAVLAMVAAALCGYQAAMMAPTEVLAAQHYETVTSLLEHSGLGLKVVLLTGSLAPAQKKEINEDIREHRADLIIGTHALFQEKVEYDALGLVVTDEQHRFGVAQREALSAKGGMPHSLIMSATPIPRTLAIILYGDLDSSVIDALPSGRLPVKNCMVGPDYRTKAYRFILGEIRKGRQAYVICPAIEKEGEEGELPFSEAEGSKTEIENVTDYSEKLKILFPPEVRIALLHGRLSASEKDRIMKQMKGGEIDILVSTTVIEVGVDVPNATVMMIENAERFGLAQLHQLRGRVGRGKEQSYCIMINTSQTEKAAQRLEILNTSNDGFHIAEEDLRLRGPGELFGERQSGELLFHLADIYSDADVLKLAEKAVSDLLLEDPWLDQPEHASLRARLDKYVKKGYTV